jgi:ankyrin repeat protein
MNTRFFFGWLCHSRVARLAVIALVALAWSRPAFCDKNRDIHEAALHGHLKKVKELLKHHPDLVFNKDDLGWIPLHDAAIGGEKDVAELLLANKADVNDKDNVGETPLHVAAEKDQNDVAELLLANNADANAKDNGGATPLHVAALMGHRSAAELLLANKADVNAKDNHGDTPLHNGLVGGDKDVAELLLAHGAEVNAKDNGGNTPLHWAALYGHKKDVVELLIARGAYVNGKNNYGQTPLSLAEKGRQTELAELLRQHMPGRPEDFMAIDKIVILPVIDSRFDKKAKVDLQDIRKNVQKILEWKHYTIIQADSPPPGARWVMVITLITLDRLSASVSAVLCDKESKASPSECRGNGGELWSGSSGGVYTSAQTQFPPQANEPVGDRMLRASAANMTDAVWALFGWAKKDALENALYNLLRSIPELPKKK